MNRCSAESCREDYTDVAGRCISERIKDHDGRDTNSNVKTRKKSVSR